MGLCLDACRTIETGVSSDWKPEFVFILFSWRDEGWKINSIEALWHLSVKIQGFRMDLIPSICTSWNQTIKNNLSTTTVFQPIPVNPGIQTLPVWFLVIFLNGLCSEREMQYLNFSRILPRGTSFVVCIFGQLGYDFVPYKIIPLIFIKFQRTNIWTLLIYTTFT